MRRGAPVATTRSSRVPSRGVQTPGVGDPRSAPAARSKLSKAPRSGSSSATLIASNRTSRATPSANAANTSSSVCGDASRVRSPLTTSARRATRSRSHRRSMAAPSSRGKLAGRAAVVSLPTRPRRASSPTRRPRASSGALRRTAGRFREAPGGTTRVSRVPRAGAAVTSVSQSPERKRRAAAARDDDGRLVIAAGGRRRLRSSRSRRPAGATPRGAPPPPTARRRSAPAARARLARSSCRCEEHVREGSRCARRP